MTADEELILEDGRVASLTRSQSWTTNATKRHVAGDLLVVVDNQTGSRIDAVVYSEGGKRKVGTLKQVVVWERTQDPALDAISSDGFEIADVRPKQAEEWLAIYDRFRR